MVFKRRGSTWSIKKREIFFVSVICFLGFLLFDQEWTAPQDLPLRQTEKTLGTDGKLSWSFHQVLEDKERDGLRFPGYIIGVEETAVKNLQVEKTEDIFDVASLNSSLSAMMRSVFNGSDRLFLSHIMKYSIEDSTLPRISSKIFYSVYDRSPDITDPIPMGHNVLAKLKEDIALEIQEQNYTHILLVSMGWNTPQLPAIGDMNSLIGQLVIESELSGSQTEFRPLVIGVTWPSQSHLVKINYPAIAYDADELGIVWISSLLNDVILPLKREHNTKVVLLGHSLGVRVLTFGLFASHWNSEKGTEKAVSVDALIGYQPSFSINRFIEGTGIEGAPYADYKDTNTKFVFTWSENDVALNLGKLQMTSPMGGIESSIIAHKYPDIFTSLSISDDNIEASINDSESIVHLDASEMLRYKTYESSGGAHSDIFRPEAARFLWRVIDAISQDDGAEG